MFQLRGIFVIRPEQAGTATQRRHPVHHAALVLYRVPVLSDAKHTAGPFTANSQYEVIHSTEIHTTLSKTHQVTGVVMTPRKSPETPAPSALVRL